jgi:hypothetical protein
MILILLIVVVVLLSSSSSSIAIRLRDDKGEVVSAVKITTYGIKNNINSITSILNTYDYNSNDNNILLYDRKSDSSNNKQYLIINNLDDDRYDSSSDIAIVSISKEAHLNDDRLLYRIQCAIQSVLGLDGEPKSTLVLLLPDDADSDFEQSCLSMARGAWAMLLNKESYRHPELTQEIDVVVTTKSKLAIQSLLDNKYELDSADYDDSLVENLLLYIRTLSKKNDESSTIINSKKQQPVSVEIYQEAVDESIEWVRKGIKDSLAKLRQATAPEKDFAIFVKNLLTGATDRFVAKTESSDLSKAVIALGKDYISKETLAMMAPFFRHQISLVRQESIKFFNAAAVDEIAISTKIIEDLNEAKAKAIRKFTSDISELIPSEAKSSWDISFDVYQLNDIFDDYIEGRKIQSQLQGVLPRGRKPIDISLHYFLNHPLGRDYRQDPLGFNEKDKIIFEKSLIDSKDVSVHPNLARPILLEQSKVDSFAQKYGRGNLKSDSEFAREMLMFPLSIKNPAVPLMSGRSRRRGGPPKKDPNRESLGPERFILWDIKPMDSIKKNLDKHIQVASSRSSPTQAEVIDKVINVIPTISQGFYSHPSINYGPKYSASNRK